MFTRTPVVVVVVHDLLPDRLQQQPRPPLGLLPKPRRARVTGVSLANHEKVGGIRYLPRAAPVPPDQDLAADASRHRRERMSFNYKKHCSNCVVYNHAKPIRPRLASLSPLDVPKNQCEIVDMDFVTDLLKSSNSNTLTAILILVCDFTKMAHFVPCHKEVTAEETPDLFFENCYRLRGVPKVVVSDRVPRFVGKF